LSEAVFVLERLSKRFKRSKGHEESLPCGVDTRFNASRTE